MFRTVKNENMLTSFSPGFFFYKENIVFFDKKAQTIFHIENNNMPLLKFLCILDDESAVLFSNILKSHESGDVVIINASIERGESGRKVLIQGSVIERSFEGDAVYFSGYCVEVKNEFSVPRIYNTAEIGLWEWDGVSGKCNFCREYHRMLGYDWPRESLPDRFEDWKKLVHPDDTEAVIFQEKLAKTPEIGDKFECFVRLRRKDGEYIWTIGKGFVAQRDHLGRAISIRGTNQNIDIVQKNYEKALEKNLRDPLTGTYNRDFFKEYWDKVREEGSWPIGFLYADICGLKMVNDLLGHDLGDKMIVKLVNIMESVIQMPKYIIRMGGDEFLIILPACGRELMLECERNLKKYREFKSTEKDIPVVFSVGSASMRGREDTLEEMINVAERNMQKNKDASRHEDILFLRSYIEANINKKIVYQDSRLYPM